MIDNTIKAEWTNADALDLQPTCNQLATDCISRQMLLEYIHGEPVGKLLCDKYNLDGLIEQFPSAQPKHTENTWKTHSCDYERAVEQLEHDMLYEPTFNQDDGSM